MRDHAGRDYCHQGRFVPIRLLLGDVKIDDGESVVVGDHEESLQPSLVARGRHDVHEEEVEELAVADAKDCFSASCLALCHLFELLKC